MQTENRNAPPEQTQHTRGQRAAKTCHMNFTWRRSQTTRDGLGEQVCVSARQRTGELQVTDNLITRHKTWVEVWFQVVWPSDGSTGGSDLVHIRPMTSISELMLTLVQQWAETVTVTRPGSTEHQNTTRRSRSPPTGGASWLLHELLKAAPDERRLFYSRWKN